ncbi:MAG: zinc ribbon domain-containing protein [Candidatus Levyibacteriota bacterium]
MATAGRSCPACGAIAATRFCPACGQRLVAETDGSARGLAPLPFATSLPARLLASLRALAAPPGRLTAEWLRGRQTPYLAPLTLFLWVNVAFFVVQSASGLSVLAWPLRAHLAQSHFGELDRMMLARFRPGTTAGYPSVFDPLESVHAKSMVILMVPAFALLLQLLLRDRRIRFRDCNSFALNLYAYALIWLCALFPVAAIVIRILFLIGAHVVPADADLAISALEAIGIGWYLAIALETVWNLPRWRSLASTLLLVLAMGLLLQPYHFAVFVATMFAT